MLLDNNIPLESRLLLFFYLQKRFKLITTSYSQDEVSSVFQASSVQQFSSYILSREQTL